MNIVSSEQKIAWATLPKPSSYTLIVSGLPAEEGLLFNHYGQSSKKKNSQAGKPLKSRNKKGALYKAPF